MAKIKLEVTRVELDNIVRGLEYTMGDLFNGFSPREKAEDRKTVKRNQTIQKFIDKLEAQAVIK